MILKQNIWKKILKTDDWGKRFNLLLDKDNYNMTEKEVKKLLRQNKIKWADFKEWMHGQTCPVLDGGEMGYFHYDVDRFIRNRTKGEPLIFD